MHLGNKYTSSIPLNINKFNAIKLKKTLTKLASV